MTPGPIAQIKPESYISESPMAEADLLYSGMIATALMLSVWVGALAAATYIFFAPSPATKPPHSKPRA